MRPNGIGIAVAGIGLVLAAGCARQKAYPAVAQATPGSYASGTEQSSRSSPRELSAGEASEGIVDVVARAQPPELSPAAPDAGGAVLIDQKVGEINGRAVRVREVLDEVGPRLATWARTRRLTGQEWYQLTGRTEPRAAVRPLTREEWLRFSALVMSSRLTSLLEDELLEAEARASLKPAEKQGLAWLVQEASQNLRRESGSEVAAQQRLEREGGMTEQQFARQHESRLLIMYQLEEKIRRRIHVSWKDVRLFYERNLAIFHPPPAARFRMIEVAAKDESAARAIQEALDRGDPFEKVAALPENTFHRDEGGFFAEKTFSGDYAKASFSFPKPLEDAAHELRPGDFTHEPISLGKDNAWLFLESVSQASRPLSDRDVQLQILLKLTSQEEELQRQNYVNHLRDRASFSDMDAMVKTLVQAAAERYWPER